VGGVQAVPLLPAQVLDRLEDGPLILRRGLRERVRPGVLGVFVEEPQRVPPGLPVLGHVIVTPAVGLLLGQPGVDYGNDRDRWLVVLAEQSVAQRGRGGLLGGREEPDVGRPPDPVQDDARGDRVPVARLVEDVEPGKRLPAARLTGSGAPGLE
jgi:hypothetical protein